VVGARFGPAATGLLQSTLGNLPELFIVIFALRAGEIVVAQTSILGSLLANALLVLGLAIIAGAWRAEDGLMRFRRRLPNDTTMLLMLVVFIIAIISTSISLGDRAADNAETISVVGAILILCVYGTWLANYIRAGSADAPAVEAHEAPPVGFAVGLGVLALAGVAAAFVSDWFVAVIDPATEDLGISKAFTGLVIVAIAGNAVENVVGIQLAWKRRYDLAISVVKNSVAQIAAFLYPALVLISMLFAQHLTFGLPSNALVLVVALVFSALAIWQITGDGEAAVYEGLALVATYAVLATVVWFE
jgi:Ca2+:H+ antiporter